MKLLEEEAQVIHRGCNSQSIDEDQLLIALQMVAESVHLQ